MAETYRQAWMQVGISQDMIDKRRLPLFTEAFELETAEVSSGGREFRLTPAAADAWKRMKTAASRSGVDIHIVSAHRSVQRQVELIAAKLDAGQALEAVLEVLAPPGCSEHHTGRAVDIGTGNVKPLEPEFESTPAFCWLRSNALDYGFELSFPEDNEFGYVYEPWHWCFSERVAQQIVAAGVRQ